MQLIEKHIIKKTNKNYQEIDNMCFLSKNLYNSALYEIRQHYFHTKKYLNKYTLISQFTKDKQIDYISLPRKISQQVIFQVDQNFKSFFSSLKSNKVKRVKIPKYLNKTGRNMLMFTNQAISTSALKENKLKLSGLSFTIKIIHNNVQCVRIIKKINAYAIEIIYEQQEQPIKVNNNYMGVDLGLNNLITTGSNCSSSTIINGKPLKSINQYFNKKLALLKSPQKNKHFNSRKINTLIYKRDNKITDYLHKSSRMLINHAVSNDISIIVIGLNKEWKQEINIGKINNQNFVNIPHSHLINMIQYKAKLAGIKVIVREESYTSKCSFLDNEEICKHYEYMGKRIKRGLFKTFSGRIINADLNGALNILRKEIPNAFNGYGIEVCSTPKVFQP